MASFRFVKSLGFAAAVCICVGPGCGNFLGTGCNTSEDTWCDGNAVTTCTLNPDCASNPDTCNPERVVTKRACPADRPVCAQVSSGAVCEVSGVKEACKATVLDAESNIGPVGDFNGDGLPDFVGTDGGDTVFLGQADGSFAKQPTQSVPPLSFTFFAADMNGDGRADLGFNVSIELAPKQFGFEFYVAAGRGDGTFAAPILFAPAPPAEVPTMTVADLDGDGVSDLAAIDSVGCEAYVTLGGPAPKAVPPQKLASPCPQGWGGSSTVVADFNGDGKADVLIPGHVVILGGSGGSLTMLPPVKDEGDWFLAGDVDEDGHVDLATTLRNPASWPYGPLALLHGHGDGTFDPPVPLPPSPYQDMLMLLTDVDGDGHLDLVSDTDGFVLELRRGLGAGAFEKPAFYDVKGVFQAAALTPNPDGTRSLLFNRNEDPRNLASRMFLSVFPSKCY